MKLIFLSIFKIFRFFIILLLPLQRKRRNWCRSPFSSRLPVYVKAILQSILFKTKQVFISGTIGKRIVQQNGIMFPLGEFSYQRVFILLVKNLLKELILLYGLIVQENSGNHGALNEKGEARDMWENNWMISEDLYIVKYINLLKEQTLL